MNNALLVLGWFMFGCVSLLYALHLSTFEINHKKISIPIPAWEKIGIVLLGPLVPIIAVGLTFMAVVPFVLCIIPTIIKGLWAAAR